MTRVGFRRDEVTKRRPDGSTYTAQRSVRVSRKTGRGDLMMTNDRDDADRAADRPPVGRG